MLDSTNVPGAQLYGLSFSSIGGGGVNGKGTTCVRMTSCQSGHSRAVRSITPKAHLQEDGGWLTATTRTATVASRGVLEGLID